MRDFDFDDLSLLEFSLKYKGKCYLVREATADAVRQYQNARSKAIRFGEEGGAQQIDGIHDADTLLLALCAFEQFTKPNGNPGERAAGLAEVRALPYRVTEPAIEQLKEISEISDLNSEAAIQKQIASLQGRLAKLRKAGESVGNAPSGTEPSSVSPEGSPVSTEGPFEIV